MAEFTNRDAIKGWSSASREVVASFGEEGDLTRRYLLNPVIFELVGTAAGKTVLDLSTWTAPSNAFDCVIANMVLMDIPDYLPALRTCIVALKRQGSLIVSLLHPCFEEPGAAWKEKGCVEVRDYFQERVVQQTYAHFIHRPLSTYLNSIILEGTALQKVIEPQLSEALAQQYQAQRYWHVPGYVVIHAVKSS